jgi:hypothetical protein
MTVRLGPVTPSLYGLTPNPQPDGLGLNERCLRRDLSNAGAAKGSTEAISCMCKKSCGETSKPR